MKSIVILTSCALFLSCSLKYGTPIQDESNVPELIFTDASFSKYEDRKKTVDLKASKLEQYADGSSMFAKDVDFKIIDKEGNVTNEGSCKLLSSNSDEEKYVLYDDIRIKNNKEDIEVTADTLRWNGKSEQLTSSRNDMVTIKKGSTTLQGSGFSASAISKQFAFTGVITGFYDSDEESEEGAAVEAELQEEQSDELLKDEANE